MMICNSNCNGDSNNGNRRSDRKIWLALGLSVVLLMGSAGPLLFTPAFAQSQGGGNNNNSNSSSDERGDNNGQGSGRGRDNGGNRTGDDAGLIGLLQQSGLLQLDQEAGGSGGGEEQQQQQQQQQQQPLLLQQNFDEAMALAAEIEQMPLPSPPPPQPSPSPPPLLPAALDPDVQLSDNLSLDDSIMPRMERAPRPPTEVRDGVGFGDTISGDTQRGSVHLSRNLSDSLSATDSASRVASAPRQLTRDVSDSLRASDQASPARHAASSPPQPSNPPAHQPQPAPSPNPGTQNPPVRNPPPSPPPAAVPHVFERSISDGLTLGDAHDVRSSPHIDLESNLAVRDYIAVSGLVVPPTAPTIAVTSPSQVSLLPGEVADISFHSTTAGSYEVKITGSEGNVVANLKGRMSAGPNTVEWNGAVQSSGEQAPPGEYRYYITARSDGGVRQPPEAGDGRIAIIGTPKAIEPGGQIDPIYLIIIAAAVTGAAGFLFLFRREKPLVMYVPAAAAEVIDDIKRKFPGAVVEDYVEPGGNDLYKGVTIKNAKGADDSWLDEIADRVKSITGSDSLEVRRRHQDDDGSGASTV